MNPTYRTILTLDWVAIVLFIALVLLSVSKYFFSVNFRMFLILPFNDKYLKTSRKKGKLFNWFHVVLTVFQIMVLSLFVFLSNNILKEQRIDFYPILYWILLFSLVAFVCLKVILQFGNGYFFQNVQTMANLVFEKLTYFNYSALLAFVGCVLMVYVLPDSKTTVYVTTIGVILINLIGFIKVLRNHQKLIVTNFIYFILYLCTLEISPLVIIVSYLKD